MHMWTDSSSVHTLFLFRPGGLIVTGGLVVPLQNKHREADGNRCPGCDCAHSLAYRFASVGNKWTHPVLPYAHGPHEGAYLIVVSVRIC